MRTYLGPSIIILNQHQQRKKENDPAFMCSKSTTETPEHVRNLLKVKSKDTEDVNDVTLVSFFVNFKHIFHSLFLCFHC